jgi:predicted SAM-dependent methyltransferase
MARKLHIGGQARLEGWEIMDALPRPEVDHLGNAVDLSRFPDGTFEELYASHVIEHFDYNGILQAALKEWYRVLSPSGCMYLSFPDLSILTKMYANGNLNVKQRFEIMRMIFGGHMDAYDYHLVGLDEPIMASLLAAAGFKSVQRVNDFGLFNDTSRSRYAGVAISCNLVVYKQ